MGNYSYIEPPYRLKDPNLATRKELVEEYYALASSHTDADDMIYRLLNNAVCGEDGGAALSKCDCLPCKTAREVRETTGL